MVEAGRPVYRPLCHLRVLQLLRPPALGPVGSSRPLSWPPHLAPTPGPFSCPQHYECEPPALASAKWSTSSSPRELSAGGLTLSQSAVSQD